MFRSAPPRGGRRVSADNYIDYYLVSIRAPAWGATRGRVVAGPHRQVVSIRAPAWGATSRISRPATSNSRFRSAPPRGGRPRPDAAGPSRKAVSIRAPAWGATMRWAQCYRQSTVSIRAPAWGATLIDRVLHPLQLVSIRAPAWGATRFRRQPRRHGRVSIRAPAWGATPSRSRIAATMAGFDPRPRVGGDTPTPVISRCPTAFRSAPPRGGRLQDS